MNRRLQEQSAEKLSSYLGDERLMKMKEYVQHGDVSTYDHAVLVAFYSCMLACRLRLKYDERALIRGALLHDCCCMIIICMTGMRKRRGISGMGSGILALPWKTPSVTSI